MRDIIDLFIGKTNRPNTGLQLCPSLCTNAIRAVAYFLQLPLRGFKASSPSPLARTQSLYVVAEAIGFG
jgi:hypothetical protein